MNMFQTILLIFALSLGLVFLFSPKTHASGTLILLVDMSDSIDPNELEYQMNSYVSVLSSLYGLSSFRYEIITFAGNYSHVVQNGSIDDALTFFNDYQRPGGDATCLGGPFHLILDLIDELPEPIIIDITGDGPHNCQNIQGRTDNITLKNLHLLIDEIYIRNVIINTLYIGQETNFNVDHYREFSEMMRGGFALNANSFLNFEYALFEKLAREIAMLNGE